MKTEPEYKSMKEMKLEDFRPSGIVCHRCGADFCEVDGHYCPPLRITRGDGSQ